MKDNGVPPRDLLDKLRDLAAFLAPLHPEEQCPGDTAIDEILGPGDVVIEGRPTLMFGSNNYLGLTFHPEVVAAAHAALDRFGAATTGARTASGTLGLHKALERDLAAAFGKRHALVFTTGYQTNLGVIAGLAGPDDVVLVDREAHASIYDAARLSGAATIAFRHNAPENLARKLARLPRAANNRLVVVEGVYSIEGDVAPLADIVAVCRQYGAYLLVDEAHSLGAYGPRRLGCADAQGVLADCDFVVGTFSKALAGVGGFCVSDHPGFEQLRFSARSYVFSASGAPATIAGVRAALGVIRRDGGALAARLWDNVRRLRSGLEAGGCTIGAVESPIVSIRVGDAQAAVETWRRLLLAGVYVNLILPPACPPDRCVLRASCSAAHTAAQIDRAIAAIVDVTVPATRTAG